MSLKRNIVASYASQIYVTVVGIALLPLYLTYMGAEAYGLVGFFAMLQAWFNLLDLGLTPTMAQQTARYQGGAMDGSNLRRLLRALEGVFIGIAALGAATIVGGSEFLANRWLKVQDLPVEQVRHAVMLMGLVVALRWVSSLYRGVVTGFERLVWLSSWNAIVATLRFVLIIPLFLFVGATPEVFFRYQLGVALLEVAVLMVKTYRLMPVPGGPKRLFGEWQPLRDVLRFSLGIAFAGAAWVLVTQIDRLLLSKILTLTDYGYFSIAVLVAGGVFVASAPVGGAIMPRLTRLQAAGQEAQVISLYRSATQLVAAVAGPAALLLAFFSKQVLWAWTGDQILVEKASPVLTLYAVGYGIFMFSAFPYYLQYAKGNMKLHLIGNFLLVVLYVPALTFAAVYYGMTGAGWAWLVLNVLYFVFWIPVVHHRFLTNLHWSWMLRDVLITSTPATLAAWLLHAAMPWPVGRAAIAVQLCGYGLLLLGVGIVSSGRIRRFLVLRYRQNKSNLPA
jgi:O-antigen/teichoic acid export membrane protein